MRPALPRILLVLSCLLLMGACSSMRRPAGETADRNVLTAAEMDPSLHPNAYAVVQALRPHWLEVRGGGGVNRNMVKRVYLDDMFLGGLELLRQIGTTTIEAIEHLDGPAATQRWGLDHAGGVIRIRSRR